MSDHEALRRLDRARWRMALLLMSRMEIRAMEALYIEAMDELLVKDLSFFHNNFAGSLTKRALGYARRFEDVFDVLCFSVTANVLPLFFVAAVLWTYSPWLIVVLIGILATTLGLVYPLIRRRQRLVDIREAASNVVAGHVADSIANAEAVRAFFGRSFQTTGYVTGPGELRALATEVLGTTVRHEFCHVASLWLNPGFANNPRWLWETVALYEAGQLVDPRTLPYMRNHRPPALSELDRIDNPAIYEVGGLIGQFIVETWGSEALRDLVRAGGRLETVLGVDGARFVNDWFEYVRRRYDL